MIPVDCKGLCQWAPLRWLLLAGPERVPTSGQSKVNIVSDSLVSLVREDEFALPPWRPGSEEEQLAQSNPETYPHNEDTLVSQVTWLHCCLTSLAASSSTPSSTWVLSGCSRCSSRTLRSCKASCSSASSQVRGQRKQGTVRQALAGTNRLHAASGYQWP